MKKLRWGQPGGSRDYGGRQRRCVHGHNSTSWGSETGEVTKASGRGRQCQSRSVAGRGGDEAGGRLCGGWELHTGGTSMGFDLMGLFGCCVHLTKLLWSLTHCTHCAKLTQTTKEAAKEGNLSTVAPLRTCWCPSAQGCVSHEYRFERGWNFGRFRTPPTPPSHAKPCSILKG